MRWFKLRGRGLRRGSLAVVTAVAAIPLVIAVGLAVDYTRLSAVRSELQRGVDAGALAGGRVLVSYPLNLATVQSDARMYFFANYRATLADAALVNGGPDVTVRAPDNDRVVVAAAADVPMMFGRLVGLSNVRTTVSSETERYSRGMELVLALDTTNSMSTGSRLTNLKAGAADLLDILYGTTNNSRGTSTCTVTTGKTGPVTTCTTNYSLLVGIVPFVATVNVSPARGSHSATLPNIVDPRAIGGTSWGTAAWKGCVKARPFPFEETSAEATPTTSPFEPYIWPSTAETVVWGGVTYAGPNYWTNTTTTETWINFPNASGKAFQRANVGWQAGSQAGPNRGCGFPIMPLQPFKGIAKQHINALAVGAKNGTTATLGFSWSWRLLSPDWRNWWQNGTWYSYNGTTRNSTSTPVGIPRDYATANDKIVVLFTDGQNEMGDGTPNSSQSCCTSAYGDWTTRPIGTTPVTELNTRTVQVCNAMKARGIKIYVVLLYASPPPAVLNTFNQNGCASGAGYFFQSATGADLRTVFREIGASLSNLRLTR